MTVKICYGVFGQYLIFIWTKVGKLTKLIWGCVTRLFQMPIFFTTDQIWIIFRHCSMLNHISRRLFCRFRSRPHWKAELDFHPATTKNDQSFSRLTVHFLQGSDDVFVAVVVAWWSHCTSKLCSRINFNYILQLVSES